MQRFTTEQVMWHVWCNNDSDTAMGANDRFQKVTSGDLLWAAVHAVPALKFIYARRKPALPKCITDRTVQGIFGVSKSAERKLGLGMSTLVKIEEAHKSCRLGSLPPNP
jgi:hypothetical protein